MKDAWWAIRRNRRAKIGLLIGVGLAVSAVAVYAVVRYYRQSHPSAVPTATTTTVTNTKAGIAAMSQRRLDGVTVPTDQSNLVPIAVMIENLATIRPQAGLSQANLVYEALAEGGITRFMAVYAEPDTISKIGPIRSARHYFVDWAEEYHGIYSYVGGSPQALGITGSSQYLIDLNQFYQAAYYYRDDTMAAPHNLFSNSELLSYARRDLELTDQTGDYASYVFKDNLEKSQRPQSVTPITIDFSSSDYSVEWRYDRDSNSYWRWNGGAEHLDATTNQQLSARNIIIQRVSTNVLDRATGRLDIVTRGQGEAMLFQDGVAIQGQWVKAERGERTQFLTATGSALVFNPGQTWIEVVPTDSTVSY